MHRFIIVLVASAIIRTNVPIVVVVDDDDGFDRVELVQELYTNSY